MRWFLRLLVVVGLVVGALPLAAGPAAAAAYQPDGLIRLSTDSTLLGDNVYNLDGAGQTRSVPVAAGSTVAFLYRVQNDGTETAGFLIRGTVGAAPFTVRYYQGFNDVTRDVTGADINAYLVNLAPGQSADLSVQLTPAYSAPAGTSQSVSVTASLSGGVPAVADTVVAAATVTGTTRRPDAMVQTQGGYLNGDDFYSTTGTDQRVSVTAAPGQTPVVLLRVQNDGNATDSMVVSGPASTASYDVRYFLRYVEVTGPVTHGGYTTAALAPGASVDLTVQIVAKSLPDTVGYTPVTIAVASAGAPSAQDVVQVYAVVIGGVHRPDGMVRRSTDTTLLGDDVYNLDGTGQTRSVTMTPKVTYSFLLRAQNDGNVVDRIVVRGSAGTAGFTVQYTQGYWPLASGNVTFPNLAPGATADLSVQITPAADAPTGATQTITVEFFSDVNLPSDPTDVVKIVGTVQRPPSTSKPDGLVRLSTDSTLLGDNVYNLDATNQTRSTTIAPGTTRSFLVRVQNDGATAESIVVTGPAGSAPFTVRYFRGYAEVTSAVTGAGLTLADVPVGGSVDLSAQISAPANAVNGNRQTVPITLTSTVDALARDVVKVEGVIAGGPSTARPDALIRRAGEATYAGDGVYGTDGAGQARATSIGAGGIAAFALRVRNDGNITDSVVVTGPATTGAFEVRYYRGYSDVTYQVTHEGFGIRDLAPGASYDLQVQLVAPSSATSGATGTVLTRFASVAAPAVVDVVAAQATVS